MTQLGIVTYNIAKDWDLPTILSRLEKLGPAQRVVEPGRSCVSAIRPVSHYQIDQKQGWQSDGEEEHKALA